MTMFNKLNYAVIEVASIAGAIGGFHAQAVDIALHAPTGTGAVLGWTGLVTAIGGIVIAVLQIIIAARKGDIITMIKIRELENELGETRQSKETILAQMKLMDMTLTMNRGWITQLLNRKDGDPLPENPLFNPDPATATPQALASAHIPPPLHGFQPPSEAAVKVEVAVAKQAAEVAIQDAVASASGTLAIPPEGPQP